MRQHLTILKCTIHSTLIYFYPFNILRKPDSLLSSFMKSCTHIYSLLAVCFFIVCVYCTSTCIMNQVDSNPICDEITDNCDYIDLSYINELCHSQKDLVVMQLNIRGLISKQDALKCFLSEFNVLPDVVLLCETWLKRDTENKISIPSYKCYHKHRLDRLGGGVRVLVNQKLKSRERTDLLIPTNLFKYNVVELKTNKNSILLVSGYRPPNSNPKKFMKEYKNVLGKLKSLRHHDLIVGMDHNFDLLKSASNPTTSQFLDMNIDKDLTPCITKLTRVMNNILIIYYI